MARMRIQSLMQLASKIYLLLEMASGGIVRQVSGRESKKSAYNLSAQRCGRLDKSSAALFCVPVTPVSERYKYNILTQAAVYGVT